ncbi:hypothetical protein F4604DRAFT_1899726 [Suillus subluteus]|nr:hypothetical protein F4604DRAFT_1899726 [Suillus subluteus]
MSSSSSLLVCLVLGLGRWPCSNGVSEVAVVNVVNPNFIYTASHCALRRVASQSRLQFNTNLRLLTAASGWYNPDGVLLNSVSAVLIISYSLASLIVPLDCQIMLRTFGEGIAIAGLPFLFSGVVLLFQVVITLSGIRAAKIFTWRNFKLCLT